MDATLERSPLHRQNLGLTQPSPTSPTSPTTPASPGSQEDGKNTPRSPSRSPQPVPKGKGKGKSKGKAPAPKAKSAPVSPRSSHKKKDRVVPRVELKPLWWTRYILGVHLQIGQTIWDTVHEEKDLIPIQALEDQFCKNPTALALKPQKKAARIADKSTELKLLRVVVDPQLVVAKEAALRKLPPPHEVARAILELDGEALSLDAMQCLLQNGCPSGEQVQQLQKLVEEHATVPFALPEQYMWMVSRIPGFQQRLECWRFLITYEELCEEHSSALERIELVVKAFRSSRALPSLLGLILAIGNYLNGGTNRGQADGFDLETIGKLETIKNPQGSDLRRLILAVFLEQNEDLAEDLVEELKPFWERIFRQLGKDSDGVEKLKKKVDVSLEDIDISVSALEKELVNQKSAMEIIIPCIDDPMDKFKYNMPDFFAAAQTRIEALVEQRDQTKSKYSNLMSWFRVSSMKSTDFCLMWDNFFVPECQFVNRKDMEKKQHLLPVFCGKEPISVFSLQVLWQVIDPEAGREVRVTSSRRRPTFRLARMGRGRRVFSAALVAARLSVSTRKTTRASSIDSQDFDP